MLAEAIVGWLVSVLGTPVARAGRRLLFDSPEVAALHIAMTAAINAVVDEVPAGAREGLTRNLLERFREPPALRVDARAPVLETVREGIRAQVAPLGNPELTETDKSYLDIVGVDLAWLEQSLLEAAVRAVGQASVRCHALAPLAAQLNADKMQADLAALRAAKETATPTLTNTTPTLAKLVNVASFPPHFIIRQAITAELKSVLLSPRMGGDRPRAAGLVGMSGAGKSVLACALARDEQVRQAYPDGIIRLELGSTPDLRARQVQLAEALGDLNQSFMDEQQGRARLSELMQDKACLLILDDVWRPEDLGAFDVLGAHSRLLLTTRNATLLEDHVEFHVGNLSEDEALQLLANWTRHDLASLPSEALEIIGQCGKLALAVAIAGAMLADRATRENRWTIMLDKLHATPIKALSRRLVNYPIGLLRALELSVTDLEPEQRERYLELAVFSGQGAVPESVVHRLWALRYFGEADSQDLIDLLVGRSLVQRDIKGKVTLHDLLSNYIIYQLGDANLRRLHSKLADSYLAAWGGSSNNLAGLMDASKRDVDNGYGLRSVVTHLCAAGRVDDVHTLLGIEWCRQGLSDNPICVNSWYTVHEQIGDLTHYISDLAIGWRIAQEESERKIGQGQLAPEIGLALRYALIIASINSIAASIPPAMLVAMVDSGAWTVPHALAFARQIPEPYPRAQALTAVAHHLRDSQKAQVCADALAAVREINFYKDERAEVVAGLAPHLPEALMSEAIEIAASLYNTYSQGKALAALARHVPEVLMAKILAAAQTIYTGNDCAKVLAALAPRLPENLIETALMGAHDMEYEEERAAVVAALAPHLPRSLTEQAVRIAQEIEDVFYRCQTLHVLAQHFPEPWLIRMLDEACVSDLPESERQQALVKRREARALRLAQPEWQRMLDGIVATGSGKYSDFDYEVLAERLDAFTMLLASLTEAERRQALAQAFSAAHTTPRGCVRTLMTLVSYLDEPPEQAQVVAAALAYSKAISDDADRVQALADVIPELPEPERTQTVAAEFAVAKYKPEQFAKALEALGSFLPEFERIKVVTDALTRVLSMRWQGFQAKGLEALAPHLPKNLLIEAFAALKASGGGLWASGDEVWRIKALAALARQLPEPEQTRLLAEALALAEGVEDEGNRIDGLSALAPHLPDPLLRQALAAARAFKVDYFRATALVGVAPHLAEPLRTEVLTEIVTSTPRHFWDPSSLDVLTAITPHLPEHLQSETLAAILAIDDELERSLERYKELETIALCFSQNLLSKAFAQIREIEEKRYLAAVREVQAERRGGEVDSEQKIKEAMQRSRAWYTGFWGDALRRLAAHVPESFMTEAMRAVKAHEESENLQANMLAALAPRLPKEFMPEALEIVRTMSDEVRAKLLIALSPYLPCGLKVEALTMVRTITDQCYRVEALAALASQLPQSERAQVVAEVLAAARQAGIQGRAVVTRYLAEPDRSIVVKEVLAMSLQALTENSADIYVWTVLAHFLEAYMPEGGWSAGAVFSGELEPAYLWTMVHATAASYLPMDERESVVAEAVAAAQAIQEYALRSKAFTAIASCQAEDERVYALSEALLAGRHINDADDRARALTAVAELLPNSVQLSAESAPLGYVWLDTLSIAANRLRRYLLDDIHRLSHFLFVFGDRQAIDTTTMAIKDVGRWWS